MINLKNKFLILSIVFLYSFAHAGDVQVVSSESDFNNAVDSGGVVVADFFATWCPPCKMLAPVLEELATDFKGKAVFLKIDVDKNSSLAQKYKIQSIPDVRVFKNKKEVEKIVGFNSKKHYKKIIDKLIKK